jgi:hypothetical protein
VNECELCDIESRDVRSGLACYADDGRFERIDRCVDHSSCRRRVEEPGGTWPLLDITDSTTGKEHTA